MQQQPHKGAKANGEREGGLLELHAQAPCLCLLFPLPAPVLPLPLQLLMVSLLSSQPFNWGLRLQEQGQGVHTGALGLILKITLKTNINN